MSEKIKSAIEFTEGRTAICLRPTSGNAQAIGWHRVADALKFFGTVRDDEEITHIAINEHGLEVFTVKRKKRLIEYLPAKQQGSRK